MSQTWFKEILAVVRYTDPPPLLHCNHFGEICQLIGEWNKNMTANFTKSWINVIDKSMSKWLKKYARPGFMFITCKLWKFGHEQHNASCGLSDMILVGQSL